MGQVLQNQVFACGKYVKTAIFLQKPGLMFFSCTELCTIQNYIFQEHISESELAFQSLNIMYSKVLPQAKEPNRFGSSKHQNITTYNQWCAKETLSGWGGCSGRNLATGYYIFQDRLVSIGKCGKTCVKLLITDLEGLMHAGITFHMEHVEIHTGSGDFDDITNSQFSFIFLSWYHRNHEKPNDMSISG